MKVKVYLILISFVLALPLMGQTAAEKALSDLTCISGGMKNLIR